MVRLGLAMLALVGAHFPGLDGCFLLQDLASGQTVLRYNDARCAVRLPPCSTFKVPLAILALDAGALKDEQTPFKWDGTRYEIDSWNRDQTAASWIRESVVWVSQRLTTALGAAAVTRYLDAFDYGTRDLSGGLTSAWLAGATRHSTLRISADEQLAFLARWWRGRLPVSARALELAKTLTFLETSPGGYTLHGKTGSGWLGAHDERRLGWFIAHLEGGGREYVAVVTFTEREPRPGYSGYAGYEARQIMKDLFAELGLW